MVKDRTGISEKKFILFTCIVSGLLAVLYCWKIFRDTNFATISHEIIVGYIIVALNLLYIPFALIFKKKGFHWFYLVYTVVILYAASLEKTFLYNNYTALFILCIVISIQPKIRKPAIIIYFAAVTALFIIKKDDAGYALSLYFIHIVRSIWYVGLVEYVLYDKFKRKKLVLYEDERRILDQLCAGKVYQKEVEGFSENTIYRKLKAARERNGNLTRDELVEAYRTEKEKIENEQSVTVQN